MRRHIENIRQRPKEVRTHFAFLAAGICTSAIFAVWAFGLQGRMEFETVDPLLAEYERELEAEGAIASDAETGVGAMLGNLRKGAAAIIFTQEDESEEEEEENDSNSIDIDALIKAPAVEREPENKDLIVVPEGNGEQVILIGTSSANMAETNQ